MIIAHARRTNLAAIGDKHMAPQQPVTYQSCGQDVRIDERAVIVHPDLANFADHVAIDAFCFLSTALRIGSHVHIGPMVSVIGGRLSTFVMEDFSGLAAGCRVACASDDFVFGSGLANPTVPAPFRGDVVITTVTLQRHAMLATNCVVFPGVTIGQGAVASAASVIKSDLEPWTIYAGNPAAAVGKRPRSLVLKREAELRAHERGRSAP
jgi:acetyltransferase-like isoleucine patch superfamily enzyme